MTTSLFRREVIDKRHGHHLGTIRIGHNVRYSAVAVFAVAFGLALASYSVWGSFTRKARLHGHLVPVRGALNLTSAHSGVVLDVRVGEGESVDAGQAIAVIGTDRATAQGNTVALVQANLQARRDALEAERRMLQERARLRQQAIDERLHSVRTEIEQLSSELATLDSRTELARQTAQRFRDLAASGYVSALQAQQKEEELLELRARGQSLRRSATALDRGRRSAEAEIADVQADLRAQLAQSAGQLARLSQESTENQARGEFVVTATQRGTITALHVHPGQSVVAPGAVATLVPNAADGGPSPLVAHLYAPSRTAGFVREGQPVWIRYGAYAYQKFGMARGRISAVSQTPIHPQDLPAGQASALLSAAQSSEPVFRLTVTLDRQSVNTYGTSRPLKPGMALEADVMQERRAIWEWALEPVLAAAGWSMGRALGAPPASGEAPTESSAATRAAASTLADQRGNDQ